MIASARLPPQPIGKIIHGRCSCHGLNTARCVSQLLQHPPRGSLLQLHPCFRLHHQPELLLLVEVVVVDAALQRQLTSINTHRRYLRHPERRGGGGGTASSLTADRLRRGGGHQLQLLSPSSSLRVVFYFY